MDARRRSGHFRYRPRATRRAVSRPVALVVEPDGLTRWSIATYLRTWFEVFDAATRLAAIGVLANRPVDALVVSENLRGLAARRIERLARAANSAVRIVRIGTVARRAALAGVVFVEKPFQLARIAGLLGAPHAATTDATVAGSVPGQGPAAKGDSHDTQNNPTDAGG